MKRNHKPTYRAHFIIGLRHIGTPFPVVVSADIYSAGIRDLTLNRARGDFYAEVLQVESKESFGDAQNKLKDLIMNVKHLAWARPWVDDSLEAHKAKYYWQNVPKSS